MLKRLIGSLFIVLGSICFGPVYAIDAIVVPTGASASVNLQALVNLTTPANIVDVDEDTLVTDIIQRRGIRVGSIFTPNSFNMVWDPVFESQQASYTSRSTEGVVSLDGDRIGAQNQTKKSACANNACPKVADAVTFTTSMQKIVVEKLLDGVTIGAILNKTVAPKTVLVVYQRVWSSDITDHVGRFSIEVSAAFNIKVNLSQTRLIDVTGSSSARALPIGSNAPTPVNLQWTARLQTVGAPAPITLKSDFVDILTPSGQLLHRIPRRINRALGRAKSLSQSFPSQTANVSTELFTDPISIPASVAARAGSSGARGVKLVRTFTDGTTSHTTGIDIPLGTSSTAGFQITRVDLRFKDGSRVKVVGQGEQVTAIVDINYLGNGQLQAVWEWAPVASGGVPFFRPLSPARQPVAPALSEFSSKQTNTLVREFLNNRQLIKLSSPALPADDIGGVLLRLRITSPHVLFQLPVLRYYIGLKPAESALEATGLRPLTLLSPATNELLDESTRFHWQSIPGTVAYRFECYSELDMKGGMVTGAIVPGDRSEAGVSALVLDHLEKGRNYWCRVVSIAGNGRLDSASKPVSLTVPE